MNKKGIELSMNFLVTIIIAIVIFGLSMVFLGNVFDASTGFAKMTTDDLSLRVSNLNCGSEKVCLGATTTSIRRGNFGIVGVQVLNVIPNEENANFKVKLNLTEAVYANKSSFIDISSNEQKPTILYDKDEFILTQNDKSEPIGLGFEVPKKAISGTYIYVVEIQYKKDGAWKEYQKRQTLIIVP